MRGSRTAGRRAPGARPRGAASRGAGASRRSGSAASVGRMPGATAIEIDGIEPGPDGLARCHWCAGQDDYRAYHDREWGFPVLDDRRLFEKICLEGFQAGLSWLTILRK